MKGKSIIVMGVSASGKTTVGLELAKAIGAKFIDGDDLHPRKNVLKMAAGTPLNDKDRAPWLERINDAVFSIEQKTETCVIVCSALKKRYRDAIRKDNYNLEFLFLDGSEELITERILQREGHFMKAEMVKSQFEALERPSEESDVTIANIENSVDEIVANYVMRLDHDM